MEQLSLEKGKQSSLFFNRLPKTAFCVDDFNEGVKLRRKSWARRRKHVQYNPTQIVSYLCFDVDKNNAIESWHDNNLPCPSLIVQNPHNGHAHLLYALKAPIPRTNAARQKPLRFMAAVEEAMRSKLGADEGFVGFLCKTPNHEAWRTFEATIDSTYDLSDLAEWVELPTKMPKRLGIRSGLGRNVETFDRLRFWAYKWLNDYKAKRNFDDWDKAIFNRCKQINDYNYPLPESEIKAIAKSVAKWTWQKYNGKMDDKDFSKLQSMRVKMRASKIKENKEKRKNEMMGLLLCE